MGASSQIPVMKMPRRVGRYELVMELAAGGMGTVYLARAKGPGGFERLVALKMVHPHLARERQFVDMFLDEGRIASRCHHPNVCAVFDVGREGATYYLVMEYLHGEPLSEMISAAWRVTREHGLPGYVSVCASIVASALEGLHAAHELKDDAGVPLEVVHRDISPHNIFVNYDGSVRVVDFGVAKALGRLSSTRPNVLKGKFAYMAPEQFMNEGIDRRTDIWSMGVTLWEMLSCDRLFDRDTEAATMLAVMRETVPRPGNDFEPVPSALARIVTKALSRKPEDRYQTAQEMAVDIRRFLIEHGNGAGLSEVSALQHTLFADAIERKALLRERVVAGGEVDDAFITSTFGDVGLTTSRPTVSWSVREARGEESSAVRPHPTRSAAPSPPVAPTASVKAIRRSHAVGALLATLVFGIFLGFQAAVLTRPGDHSLTASREVVLPTVEVFLQEPTDDEGEPRSSADDLAQPAAVGSGPDDDALLHAQQRAVDEALEAAVRAGTASPAVATETSRTSGKRVSRLRRAGRRSSAKRAAPQQELLDIATPGGWAEVRVDGESRGRTPARLSVSEGSHRIELRPFGRDATVTRTVRVSSSQSNRLVVPLTAGDER